MPHFAYTRKVVSYPEILPLERFVSIIFGSVSSCVILIVLTPKVVMVRNGKYPSLKECIRISTF